MPSEAGNPTKNPRWNNRGPKAAAASTSTEGVDAQERGTRSQILEKKRQKARRRAQQDVALSTPDSVLNTSSPSLTDPLPIPQQDNPAIQIEASHPPSTMKSGTKKNTVNARKQDNASPSTTPRRNASPRTDIRTNSMTPIKSSGTPTQAYAGPTFHASPAPSALPIPKFFSRSVPQPNKGSLKAMMDGNASEESSEKSEDSPTLKNSQQASEIRAREESPLDIFFKADMDEKAKRRTESPQVKNTHTSSSTQPVAALYAPSPSLEHVRHHSRHPTDNSNGGLFSLDMDDADKSKIYEDSVSSEDHPEAQRSNTAPPEIITLPGRAVQHRKAKTEALKKLLLSPQPQHSSKAHKQSYLAPGSASSTSLSSSPSSARSPLMRSTSGSSTPTSSSLYPTASPSIFQQSLSTTTSGSPRSRPASSLLRQEVTINKVPEVTEVTKVPELPSSQTPPPSRAHDLFLDSAMSQNNRNISLNKTISPFTSVYTPELRSGVKTRYTRDPANVKLMEDDLRRILKLDILAGEGATGVRS